MAFKRVAGTCYLKRDGVQFALRGQLTISPARVVREMVVGLDGVHGYIEKPRAPYIEAELTKTPDLSLTELFSTVGGTIQAECADGTVYVMGEGVHVEESDLNAAEGSVRVRFGGREIREMKA